ESPIQSWKWISPSVVCAVKSGAVSPIVSAIPLPPSAVGAHYTNESIGRVRVSTYHPAGMRAALATVAVAALAAAASAGANNYAGTVATGGSVSVAGTLIKCRVAAGVLGCVVFKNGKPNPAAWAFTIGDKEVQAGKVSDNSASYT